MLRRKQAIFELLQKIAQRTDCGRVLWVFLKQRTVHGGGVASLFAKKLLQNTLALSAVNHQCHSAAVAHAY